ncbi:MAG: hypothetical protein E6Q96_08765 [Cyclobacteriaceae bacterium]|nr:MAG: hypothetical protein E6Q96_08765 [Cyclobacteriaceae bacterium]
MRVVRTTALFFLVSTCSVLFAQAQFTSKPSVVLDTIPEQILAAITSKLDAENSAIAIDKSKVRAFIKTINKERADYIVKMFNDDWLLGDSELNKHITTIFKNLLQSNPQLQQDASVYLYRSNSPNALSYGEGTILLSLSLLSRLENDAQVAFVLSHELAHYHLGHTKTAIEKFAQMNFDKEVKKEIRSIRSSQYKQYSRMKELMSGIEFTFNKHSRLHEFEADSLGLQLFLNSRYADNRAPIRTMELLDSVDYPVFNAALDLKMHFDFKQYPFKDLWLTYTKSKTWHAKKDVSDTAQTHPGCLLRARKLESQIANQSRAARFDVRDFEEVKFQARLDLIDANYHFKHYGKALYEAIHMGQVYPDNIYLHAMIAKCFYQLYLSQKNHELAKVLDLPDPRFPENYDRFLTFLHTLRLGDLERIAYYYVTAQGEKFFKDEEFLHALWLCSQLPVSNLSTSSVEEDYRRLFPEGKYVLRMK